MFSGSTVFISLLNFNPFSYKLSCKFFSFSWWSGQDVLNTFPALPIMLPCSFIFRYKICFLHSFQLVPFSFSLFMLSVECFKFFLFQFVIFALYLCFLFGSLIFFLAILYNALAPQDEVYIHVVFLLGISPYYSPLAISSRLTSPSSPNQLTICCAIRIHHSVPCQSVTLLIQKIKTFYKKMF